MSGHTAGDAEIWHPRLVMYQMDENRVYLNRIMRSGTVLGVWLWIVKSCMQYQLFIKLLNIVFSSRESYVLAHICMGGCWNPGFKASYVYQMDENHVFVKRIMRSGTVLVIPRPKTTNKSMPKSYPKTHENVPGILPKSNKMIPDASLGYPWLIPVAVFNIWGSQ